MRSVRKAWLIGTAIGATIVGIVGNYAMRMTWRTATSERIQEALPPQLRGGMSISEWDTGERYYRLQPEFTGLRFTEIQPGLSTPGKTNAERFAISRKFWNQNWVHLEKISDILAEGSFCRSIDDYYLPEPGNDRWGPNAPRIAPYPFHIVDRNLVPLSASLGLVIGTLDRDKSDMVALLMRRLSDRFLESSDSLGDFDLAMETARASFNALGIGIQSKVLSEQMTRRLLRTWFYTDRLPAAMRSAIAGEFRHFRMPILRDPRLFLMRLSEAVDGAGADSLPGNFDSIEAAKLQGRIYMEAINSVSLPLNGLKTPEAVAYRDNVRALPNLGNPGLTGFSRSWAMFRYRIAMARIPNSFLYHQYPEPIDVRRIIKQRDWYLTWHTLVGVRMGIYLYQLRHHALPTDLEALVADRILDKVPQDPHGDPAKPRLIRFDPARNLIWSVGADGVDNGGFAGRDDIMATK